MCEKYSCQNFAPEKNKTSSDVKILIKLKSKSVLVLNQAYISFTTITCETKSQTYQV